MWLAASSVNEREKKKKKGKKNSSYVTQCTNLTFAQTATYGYEIRREALSFRRMLNDWLTKACTLPVLPLSLVDPLRISQNRMQLTPFLGESSNESCHASEDAREDCCQFVGGRLIPRSVSSCSAFRTKVLLLLASFSFQSSCR